MEHPEAVCAAARSRRVDPGGGDPRPLRRASLRRLAGVPGTIRRDLAWRMWRDGYDALAQGPVGADPDVGRTQVGRLLGRRVVVLRGEPGVRIFYDPAVVDRRGAVPPPLAHLLFGRGAVHGLEGEAHARRRAVFLVLLDREWSELLADEVGQELCARLPSWSGRSVSVFDELVGVYGRSVLRHAGIDLDPPAADRIARRLAAVVDGFGFAGTAYLRAWWARRVLGRWATRLLSDVRRGAVAPPPESVLARLALHEGADRRLAPFVPALTGLVRRSATVDGIRLEPGDRVLLDVPGTDTSPAAWPDPLLFDPHRFDDEDPGPWTFVAQGGGPIDGHRCPGEPATVAVMARTMEALAPCDLRVEGTAAVDRTRVPTLPARGLRVRRLDVGGHRPPGATPAGGGTPRRAT